MPWIWSLAPLIVVICAGGLLVATGKLSRRSRALGAQARTSLEAIEGDLEVRIARLREDLDRIGRELAEVTRGGDDIRGGPAR